MLPLYYRYPFEINMVFYAVTPVFGVDTITFGLDRNELVMVTILGEVRSTIVQKLK